jgi:methyltransferase (TIGR00027 family)
MYMPVTEINFTVPAIDPEQTTQLLIEAVPVTAKLGFQFLAIEKGYCKAVLPLNRHSANQHGTHQGLLLGVAADYTGGMALASIIENEPVLGIHNISNEKGMCLWLAKEEITYVRPSVDDVYLESVIEVENHPVILQRYHSGATILYDVHIRLYNGKNETVAKAVFKYYCKMKKALLPAGAAQKADSMHTHLVKTNARLLARLRCIETNKQHPLFTDEIAVHISGKQGEVIANRFLAAIPDLQNFVSARVFHLTSVLREQLPQMKQVVFIGTGLDFYIYRTKEIWNGIDVFEMDLPSVIEERLKTEANLQLQNPFLQSLHRIQCSLENDDIAGKLLLSGFDPSLHSLFIYEGSSMYFTKATNKKIIDEMALLIHCNTSSLLWMDMVDENTLLQKNPSPDISAFLQNMARLGKPLCTGLQYSDAIFEQAGLCIRNLVFANNLVKLQSSSLSQAYSFALLSSFGKEEKSVIKPAISKNRYAFERLIQNNEGRTDAA